MTIVIPMAGASSRFISEGYKPKYMLELKPGYTMFRAALESFKDFFADAIFLFITNSLDTTLWVESQLSTMNAVKTYKIVTLDGVTKGQAETVYLGLRDSYSDFIQYEMNSALHNKSFYNHYQNMLVVFNIDTIRHNFRQDLDALLEDSYADMLMRSEGTNVQAYYHTLDPSNIALFDAIYDPDADPTKYSFCSCTDVVSRDGITVHHAIAQTVEKKQIGPWCSTGLYIFPNSQTYIAIYKTAITKYAAMTNSEELYNYYIAPLYNILVKTANPVDLAQNVTCYVLPCDRKNVDFAGVPADYEKLRLKYNL